MLSVKPTWWRFDEAGRSGEAFFNKRAGVLLLLQSELDAALFLLAGRGGEGEEKLGIGCCSVRRRGRLDVLLCSSEAVCLRSSSMMAASAAMILGQQRPLRAVMCSRHRGLLFLQAKEEPRWRIFDPSATSHADGDPSGMFPGVAGGGCCSGSCSGREEGLDCFPNFYFQESESYRGTIRRHVDLDAMRRKLDGGSYPSSELYRDLLLLCANAAVYLPRHAPEHASAALHALRLVSAQVSASLREPTPPKPKRELLLGGGTVADQRRAEADIVGPLIQKAAKPLIFCRKRSSIAKSAAATAVAAAMARKEAAEKTAEVAPAAQDASDGEKKAAKDKAWGVRTKKTRGPGKNSAAAKAAAAAAAKAAEDDATEADNKKSDAEGAAVAGGFPKKRIAVDFLKRLNQGTSTTKKRGSPLTKRKRSAPEEAEEEQPKARRGPGRKSTGRGGRGGKAGATKRGVGRPPAKRGPAPATPPPAKRAKVNNRTERSSSSSRRGRRKS